MLDNKYFSKFIVVLTAAAVVVVFAAMFAAGSSEAAASQGMVMGYEDTLFDTSQIMEVEVLMDEAQWQELLDNAISETFYTCDVVVNGVTYKNCAIRAKGNTSLSMVASSDSDRYSFKIKFDEYVDGQNVNGLTSLILNNNYADATQMKEALAYDMFAFLGADASLYNYAKFSVNGTYTGIYLALEPVEEDFTLRNYGLGYGELYKPDSMDMGGMGKMKDFSNDDIKEMLGLNGDKEDAEMPENFDMSQIPDMGNFQMPGSGNESETGSGDRAGGASGNESEQSGSQSDRGGKNRGDWEDFSGGEKPGGFGGGGFGGFGGSSASLNYIDDSLDSYSTIWNGEVFETTDSDHQRVVNALQVIADDSTDNETLEQYLDVDNMLKYMAVHTFMVNLDSLSGSMAHNYYLYEDDGPLNIIPWDYNLSLGGFQSGNASSTINFPIDTPFSSGISLEDRQIFACLLEDETYLAQYHQYLQQLVDQYVGGGKLSETMSRIQTQIDQLVKEDPTAFFTYDQYTEAVEVLRQTMELRAESIRGQLNGTIPSTTEGQNADSSALIDASSLDLSVMGSMMGGGGGFGGFGDFGGGRGDRDDRGNREDFSGGTENSGSTENSQNGTENSNGTGQTPPEGFSGQMPGNMQLPEGMELPEGMDFSGGMTPPAMPF